MAIYRFVYGIRQAVRFGWRWGWAKFYHEPMLRSVAAECGAGLQLMDDIPNIFGSLAVRVGSGVTIEGDHTWVGGRRDAPSELIIGDDSYLGYQVQISVGLRVTVGRSVMISNRVIINGYDGHPLDPVARANHQPADQATLGVVDIGDYSWLCANSTIMKNVSIGRGAVVAAGAIVTHDVPALAIVAGNPARIVGTVTAPASF